MTITDIINISLSSITVFTAILSICISIFTLRQNNKMIEENTRPNIQIYSTQLDSMCYVIIKNFGASSAIIDDISCDYEFSRDETGDREGKIFDLTKGAIVAPNQSLRCPLMGWNLKKTTFKFDIKYHSFTHMYSECFVIDILANSPFANINSSKSDEITILHHIYTTMLEGVKQRL